jgi:hypothetical protein
MTIHKKNSDLTEGLRRHFEFHNGEGPHQCFGVKARADIYRGEEMVKKAA